MMFNKFFIVLLKYCSFYIQKMKMGTPEIIENIFSDAPILFIILSVSFINTSLYI